MEMLSLTKTQINVYGKNFLICILASIFIGLAKLAFVLPFSPVPISFQTHTVLFLALMLGSKRAAYATFLFLVQGAMGLPVFAFGTSTLSLLGPTGGYLMGYLVAAYVAGCLFEKSKKSFIKGFVACEVSMIIIYLSGFIWLQQFVGVSKALTVGVLPFVLVDCSKTMILLSAFQLYNSLFQLNSRSK